MSLPRTVVIPAAGIATRFLPASKAIPKEMFPLVDKPLLQYGLEEAAASGLSRALIITAAGKGAMENHFYRAAEIEEHLLRRGDEALLRRVREPEGLLALTFVRQPEARGLGHAIGLAGPWLEQEPFAVLLPDDIMVAEPPVLAQMLAAYQRVQASIVAVERMPREEISRYGVVAVQAAEAQAPGGRLYRVSALVEKPRPQEAPSELAIMGRYLLTPGIFPALEETAPGALGEVQITDALARLLAQEPVYAYEYEGTRYDAGTPLGLLHTAVALALKRPELGTELRRRLRGLLEEP